MEPTSLKRTCGEVDNNIRHTKRLLPTMDDGAIEKAADVLKSGRWSDFTIKCQGVKFSVHRLILHGHSPYLDTAVEGVFKESRAQELDLSTEEPVIVAIVLWFIYTKHFRMRDLQSICALVNEPLEPVAKNSYLLLIKVHQLANYLMMHKMSKIIFRRLAELTGHYFASVGRAKEERNLHRPLFLESVNYLFDESNESVEKVKDLYAWILTIMNDRRSKLYSLSDSHLEHILERHPTLGVYMYKSMAAQARQEPKCSQCECLMTREKSERCLVVDFGHVAKWVRCVCSWRGLCSDECFSIDNKTSRGGARCGVCCKSINPIHAYQKRSFVWKDEGIKLLDDAEPDSLEAKDGKDDTSMVA